jgi:hypothetical protein
MGFTVASARDFMGLTVASLEGYDDSALTVDRFPLEG